MRVTKKAGQFVVEDGPMRVEGAAAQTFLAQMRQRDATGNDPARKQFLEECARIYQKTTRK